MMGELRADSRRWRRIAGVAGLALCGAVPLGAQAQPTVGSSRQYIVYGEDDRREVYDVADPAVRDLALRSAVALMTPEHLQKTKDGYVPASPLLGEQLLCVSAADCFPMCSDEPFLDQPSAADCSGVLIDDDLVLTAGHCFDGPDDDCDRYVYAFDFAYTAEEELLPIPSSAVYGCEELVHWDLQDVVGAEARDFAIVKLDRPVDDARQPVELRTESLQEGEALIAVGFPVGLPAKVDVGGRVQDGRDAQQDYFTATTDTFVGNSGSGLFDTEGRLVGHLIFGGEDFFENDSGRFPCLSTVVIPDQTTPPLFEHGVYTRIWRDELCGSEYPSERLCGDDWEPSRKPAVPSGRGDAGVDGPGDRPSGAPKAGGGRCSTTAANAPIGSGAFAWLAALCTWLFVRRRTA